MAAPWANTAGFNLPSCLPCCEEPQCWLTIPTLLIDGNTAPFANSTEAQNFFDNSGAAVGCTFTLPNITPCNCLVEAQTNLAPETTGYSSSFESLGPNYLHTIWGADTTGTATATHQFLCKISIPSPTDFSAEIFLSCSPDNGSGNANIAVYYANMNLVTSNAVSNASLNTVLGWSAWQNFTISVPGLYYIHTIYSGNSSASNGTFTIGYQQNLIANSNYEVCSLRADYGTGFIYCQSELGP